MQVSIVSTKGKSFLTLMLFLSLAALFQGGASAQAPAPAVPEGFYPIAEAPGISMYQKDYSGGSPDYVQVIDLSQGARIVLMHGDVREDRPGQGSYGGPDARLQSRSLAKYWEQLTGSSPDAFCVTNGQFFYMPESPTRLPFPLKVDGQIVTDGYGLKEFPDQKLILQLWDDHARITELTVESLYLSDAPDIVAGLTETASKRIDRYVARTFVGVDDRDLDGFAETVLVFNSSLSRQSDAAGVLESFGADRVMMLDGGGSTQLRCGDKSYIYSERLIPQAIGIIAASTPYLPLTPDPAAGENFPATPAADQPDASTSPVFPEEGGGDSPLQNLSPADPASPQPIQFSDVLIVPLMMSPVLAIVMFVVNKIRFQQF